jgi:hypothetical protein
VQSLITLFYYISKSKGLGFRTDHIHLTWITKADIQAVATQREKFPEINGTTSL